MKNALDRDRFLKLLALAQSDSDGESLAALRRASRMLRDAGTDWDEVVVTRPTSGWRAWFSLWAAYGRELKARRRAERAAENWRVLARLREGEIATLKANGGRMPSRDSVRHDPLPVTGHRLIDGLLASERLDAKRRARVEAIATWFVRTRELTPAEQTDLESFVRQLEAA